MKIGLGQLNTIVGDFKGNAQKILSAYHRLCENDAELVVFSELVITGYSPKDLLSKVHFVEGNRKILDEIAKEIGSVPAAIGFVDKDQAGCFYNAAAWCENGEVKHIAHKCLLPTYGVFDEDRYFMEGQKPTTIHWKGKHIGLTICEDIWTGEYLESHRLDRLDPVEFMKEQKVDLIINLSASPWNYHKHKVREDLLESVAQRCNCPVVYCNQVGGNDELIFDGRSFIANADGSVRASLKAFEEAIKVIDIEGSVQKGEIGEELEEDEEIFKGLVLGLRDYLEKSGFNKVIIGLSGGIDSAVTICIAAEAIGAENIYAYSLPSEISSEHSRIDAQELADTLGIPLQTLPIQDIVDVTEKTLAPIIAGTKRDTTEENIHARTRGMLLMAASNKLKGIVLSTGNKSEMAVGYCTLYGDMAGGLGILSDVLKTKVYNLAHYINRDAEVIPNNTIEKPPSAELKPNQTDQDTLPDYDVLDEIICYYVEEHYSVQKIIELGIDADIAHDIVRKIDFNEYKRKQAAPGLKITTTAFGVGRKMPIVQKYLH